MNIQITTKKSEGVERLLEVSVPVETVRDAEEQTARRYATQARLPGFRPGKAPASIIRKKFKDAIRQQVIETLIQEAFKEVMDREKFDVAGQPHIHDLKFDEGQPMTFELHIEVRPTIEITNTSGFTVTRPVASVTDETVNEQLDTIRDQKASWTPSESKPAPGDMVTVLLATAEDDGTIPEGKEYRLELGGGQAIAGVEELIMEMTTGETIERPVKWPDDFPDDAQKGKTKPVRVTLQDVKKKSMPALDDAFAREVGDFDSLDALRAAVKSDLVENSTRESEAQVRQQLVDKVVEANPFEIPPSWVNQMIDAYMKAYQVPEEERERFAGEFRTVAERQVRRDVIIDTLAEKHELKASEKDVDEKIAEMAAKRGADAGAVYSQLQKAGRLNEIERSLTEEKVFAWLMNQNTVE
ncbi:MAG: Trigger factor [Gemmatimonadetes bacterium]|nr:Trigger factor [Gemmatimonadota bacterium]